MRTALALVLLVTSTSALAQTPDRGVLGAIEGRQATPGGYFLNAKPGEPTTRIYVWGQVLRPGVYDVGPDFDLEGVMTLAGIPVDERYEQPGDAEFVVRLLRSGFGAPVFEGTVHELVRNADLPDLAYGDVLEVERVGVARVAVWGAVSRPGIYEVGPDFTSRDVLALAGGPDLQVVRAGERRETMVYIYRAGGEADAAPQLDGRTAAYAASLDAFLSGGAPLLRDGDVLQIESSLDAGWTTRDTLTVAGIVTSASIAVAQFLRLLAID